MDRDRLARYGLRVTDAEDVLESALLGKLAAKMIDEQGRAIDILVKPDLPENPDERTLAALPVMTPDGGKIPLADVSTHDLVEGVSRVYREQGERRIAVKCSVRDRPVVDFVKDADARIRAAVQLPEKYRMSWSGSFENAERASQQLLVIGPLCLIAMMIVLYTWFGRWRLVGFLLWEIPFAAVGGLGALRLMHLNISISAAAGAIVLTGVAFLTAMMLLSEWRHSGSARAALEEKCRSILASNGVAIVGLIPAAFSHGIGAETAKPFAVIILGGLVTSLLFSLTLLPALMARSPLDRKRGQGRSHEDLGEGERLIVDPRREKESRRDEGRF
jgi:cobalt-zinc-cadmium resistance protein CzcA